MEKIDDNERKDFEDFCNNAHESALSVSTLIDKKLSSFKENDKEKNMWVSFEFNQVSDKINSFDRPEYLDHQCEINYLYGLFKAKGYLYNTEELNKLQQAMNLYEKFKCLQISLVNITLAEERLKRQKNKIISEKDNDTPIDVFALTQVTMKLNDLIHLVVPPTKIWDFVKIATCHNWDQVTETFYIGCQTNELKCVIDEFQDWNKDLIYANIGRSGLFISKKGKPIKAHCLSASSYKKLKTRGLIHNIIAQYTKKY